jgi:UDP-N-acetylglucosamine acyltransferase
MASIHPTAIVDPHAELAADVTVGPYSIVGPGVRLAEGVAVSSHVVIDGRTEIGPRCRVFPFAAVGLPPQDLKYRGEPSRLEIGADTVVREHVTINPGTEGGGMVTRVGGHCLLMVGAHVAHDCQVGDHVVMANHATLAGHVRVGDHAVLGGLSAVHQFVRIGRHAIVGGMSGVESDVIPYGSAVGDRAHLMGLNVIGLKRRGFPREEIHALREAYRVLFGRDGPLSRRLEEVAATFPTIGPVMDIVGFIREETSRAICQPKDANDV